MTESAVHIDVCSFVQYSLILWMPTVHREAGLRFFFFSNEGIGVVREPPHIHVAYGHGRPHGPAKFWLAPVRAEEEGDLRRPDMARARRIIVEHEAEFLEAWHRYFG